MTTNPFDDFDLPTAPPTTRTSTTTFQTQSNQMDDPTSTSYIPRMARTVPHSSTVHTIFIKKITYPMTSRPDELWILERTTDGMETWRTIETFLENTQLTQDPRAVRATANQWRMYYDVSPISSSFSTASLFPVLPHPEHSNVHFEQPVSTVPDHTYIYYNPVGDAPHNIILKVLLYRFIGHHGARLTFFTSRNNSWSYDTTSDVGTHGLHTWTYTT